MTDPVEQYEHELISTSLDVEQLDTTLFRSKSLWVPTRARGVFGGQVISQALFSATNTVEPDYALHSLHCYFLLSASASIPIIYFVETVRRGRTYTTRSVKASQSGRLIFIMLCSFQKPEPLQLSQQLAMSPNIPPPESIILEETRYDRLAVDETIHPRLRTWYQTLSQDRRRSPIEIRFISEGPDEKEGWVTMYWMKVKKRGLPDNFPQSFQKCMLAYLSDHHFTGAASRALGLTRTPGPRQQTMGSTLDHSIFFYNHEFDCTDYVLYVMSSPAAAHGRGVSLGRIYSQKGDLIAVLTQEGVLRVDPAKTAKAKEKEAKL
ncbi:hypothetical protein M422DRAFT_35223 [Sphaerobolus stellatus SS14]|uniref:Acyl-CoA thioesterase II n=1 Tax=Sphaerobolus stellatus (strain SS14) TaxID=990650 RepID=A0A0C9UXZ0_SPHS4|nr:hypothetical protein M422DRAFT_35223 [Sphaerobolus stellatus SS14]